MPTTLQSFIQWLEENKSELNIHNDVIHNAKLGLLEEEIQLKDAILHSLDEDGHTGEWKIKFAEKYYEKLSGISKTHFFDTLTQK